MLDREGKIKGGTLRMHISSRLTFRTTAIMPGSVGRQVKTQLSREVTLLSPLHPCTFDSVLMERNEEEILKIENT